MKISVIIPVYNSQKYLPECIESIRKQTYQNLEILLIDDGSKDESGKICDEYAEKDKRIHVIHQKNSGTSAARNTGLKHATGDYVMFMDNDDYWKGKHSLEKLVQQLKESEPDVLMFSSISYWQNRQEYVEPKQTCKRENIKGKSRAEVLSCLIEKGLLYRAVWVKVIKKSLILEKNLFFVEGIRNEDSEWTAKLLLYAQTYDWVEAPFYVYRKGHENAQTSKPNTYRTVLDLKEIFLKYVEIAKKNKKVWEPEFYSVYLSYFAYLYSVWMAQADMLSGEDIKQDIQEMKKYASILKYDLDPSVKLVKKVYRIAGYRITAKLLNIYMKRKYHVQDEN